MTSYKVAIFEIAAFTKLIKHLGFLKNKFVSTKEQAREFELNMFVYCSLDIVEERLEGINKAQELFLGSLFADQKYKSYGYVSNTNVKMLMVTDIRNVSLTDQDIRAMFKKLHAAYCDAVSNPFYVYGEPVKSKFVSFVTLMNFMLSGVFILE
ncbi:unnamed protein product [Enterobius vermicularis]|uniref:Trafficking protein particle complex subunit 2-like protein n=1 Tax=Enterobius vermicularis TaxID=51028 RepID=A0A0N4VGZ6_ENTVE|nr:unnamed protein product [Enterobius vermicularis]